MLHIIDLSKVIYCLEGFERVSFSPGGLLLLSFGFTHLVELPPLISHQVLSNFDCDFMFSFFFCRFWSSTYLSKLEPTELICKLNFAFLLYIYSFIFYNNGHILSSPYLQRDLIQPNIIALSTCKCSVLGPVFTFVTPQSIFIQLQEPHFTPFFSVVS